MTEQHLPELPDPNAELERAFGFLVEKRRTAENDGLTGCTSYVQRKLQCGFNRAAHLLEAMVERGWLTEADRYGARRITRAFSAGK
jgi:DNA segregation ATPase FtsK/SpoIIIE-like protein